MPTAHYKDSRRKKYRLKLKVENIHKSYDDLLVLEGITIDFLENKTTCILGPSGCGKTTLLNIIAGLLDPDKGQVKDCDKENISFVFQEDRLIEWKTVRDNISFVLKGKMNEKEIDRIIDKYLKMMKLEDSKYYYPNKLSGGMRQRISILRAFAYPSNLLLMDEPFKSLDIKNKEILIDFFKKLQEKDKKTSIVVTHDIDEALEIGDQIVILTDKPSKVVKIMKNVKYGLDKKRIREGIEESLNH